MENILISRVWDYFVLAFVLSPSPCCCSSLPLAMPRWPVVCTFYIRQYFIHVYLRPLRPAKRQSVSARRLPVPSARNAAVSSRGRATWHDTCVLMLPINPNCAAIPSLTLFDFLKTLTLLQHARLPDLRLRKHAKVQRGHAHPHPVGFRLCCCRAEILTPLKHQVEVTFLSGQRLLVLYIRSGLSDSPSQEGAWLCSQTTQAAR